MAFQQCHSRFNGQAFNFTTRTAHPNGFCVAASVSQTLLTVLSLTFQYYISGDPIWMDWLSVTVLESPLSVSGKSGLNILVIGFWRAQALKKS